MELWGIERDNKERQQQDLIASYNLQYVGHGPKATGFMAKSFKMKPGLYARCTQCGSYVELASGKEDRCICGSLFKDASVQKFGSAFGNNEIEIYKAVQK
ncbi:MAG: hypothetical protein RR848_05820 [Oscillospiraceae bacterium]